MSLPRIVITAGEPAGIGPDVTLKALQSDITARIAVVADADLLQRRANMLGIACDIQKLDRPKRGIGTRTSSNPGASHALLGRRCPGHLECC